MSLDEGEGLLEAEELEVVVVDDARLAIVSSLAALFAHPVVPVL